jgi:hypothetical protein
LASVHSRSWAIVVPIKSKHATTTEQRNTNNIDDPSMIKKTAILAAVPTNPR